MFAIPRWLVKRAAHQVIRIFRKHNAISAKNAKTLDELGLRPRGFLDRMFRGRDYKPYALNALINAKIVHQTEDGRLYLSEDNLSTSNLSKYTRYSI